LKSRTTERFRTTLERLPAPIRHRAAIAYELFRDDPYHPSLRFKQVHPVRQVFSVRIGLGYRARGVREDDDIVWFWIGSHTDYDRLLSELS
jgi:hypothetical protein